MLFHQKSKLHGKGLFSDKPIKKGELIGEFRVVPAIYRTKFTIWIDDEPFRATNILKYSNHSNKPNSYIDFPFMYATKNIKANSEITWDYGEDFEH